MSTSKRSSVFKKRPLTTLVVLTSLLLQTACGTLLYPERRGQTGGKIDPGVAILDGLGLLLFVIPGIIAFAVDFSDGTIYLPPGKTADQARVIHVNPKNLTRTKLAAIIKKYTGKNVTLTEHDMKILRQQNAAQADKDVVTYAQAGDHV